MAHITIEIPDDPAHRLEQFQSQLPEVLELGLQEFQSQQRLSNFLDEQDIIALLASQPTPDQILALRPSLEFQERGSKLLAESKAGTLSTKGEAELERYLTLEHLVRLAKTHALAQLQ
ncbi:hypothetical protein [Nodosilinea sp. E11]|uniref:hypothetical protein n=1 Tax=Nodosilinea sp. E11 TaxID=3037479 RepID=UPI0029352FDB|nr:hypothetical protein [Nodosilinea sp. E11]WOD38962.1 hypothetical protein RRF56_22410 [Nodosilinea sp. E11]